MTKSFLGWRSDMSGPIGANFWTTPDYLSECGRSSKQLPYLLSAMASARPRTQKTFLLAYQDARNSTRPSGCNSLTPSGDCIHLKGGWRVFSLIYLARRLSARRWLTMTNCWTPHLTKSSEETTHVMH